MRRVLLVEPLLHVHSLVHFRAALGSTGFENTHFTIATSVATDADKQRVVEFCQSHKHRVDLRLFELGLGPMETRWQCWQEFGRRARLVEKILRRESFDLVVYLMIDNILPF